MSLHITVDQYEKHHNKEYVFVNGYCIPSANLNIAYNLARENGQEFITVRYFAIDKPVETLKYSV